MTPTVEQAIAAVQAMLATDAWNTPTAERALADLVNARSIPGWLLAVDPGEWWVRYMDGEPMKTQAVSAEKAINNVRFRVKGLASNDGFEAVRLYDVVAPHLGLEQAPAENARISKADALARLRRMNLSA